MAEKKQKEGMPGPYQFLDLTGEAGLLCGKIFGDLQAAEISFTVYIKF